MCKELISDYSPQAYVIIPGDNCAEKLSIGDLLPKKYKGVNQLKHILFFLRK